MIDDDPFLLITEILKELFSSAHPHVRSIKPVQSLIPRLFPLFPEHTQEIIAQQHVLSNIAILLSKDRRDQEFSICFTSYLKQMIFLLEPFLALGKEHSELIAFLLYHHSQIAKLTHDRYPYLLFRKLHPEGWDSIKQCLIEKESNELSGLQQLLKQLSYYS